MVDDGHLELDEGSKKYCAQNSSDDDKGRTESGELVGVAQRAHDLLVEAYHCTDESGCTTLELNPQNSFT